MKRGKVSAIISVIHEVTEQRHRIILAPADAGEWFSVHDVAIHKQYFAVHGASELPQGVFTTRAVEHAVLS